MKTKAYIQNWWLPTVLASMLAHKAYFWRGLWSQEEERKPRPWENKKVPTTKTVQEKLLLALKLPLSHLVRLLNSNGYLAFPPQREMCVSCPFFTFKNIIILLMCVCDARNQP